MRVEREICGGIVQMADTGVNAIKSRSLRMSLLLLLNELLIVVSVVVTLPVGIVILGKVMLVVYVDMRHGGGERQSAREGVVVFKGLNGRCRKRQSFVSSEINSGKRNHKK